MKAVHARLAIDSVATPEDVTPAVLFAATDEAGYCVDLQIR